ncbi:hypothetical protein B0T26DRAFT_805265 [Lasiosphaeria miniovina]|uniref:Uncharacterized protein n=1 Tax=Lasiosphaeria miniovina TaxID=1954250 RepID=A0AA40A5I3_9PEZI|nr:uncharacterized protein B0T26DRAFT_805265 [Lasiosphaeria miniovina]KAK0709590.1 hypothetical protein B0T26DRAFT_805265 [Lasiosphaeria miniovina]
MAVEGATQALIATFSFGILLNAAISALVLFIKGHGTTVFRDGPRLVLLLFLFSSALWAQIDFITIIIDTSKSSMPCQIGIVFSTIFDQLARFSIEQYLLWAMSSISTKLTVAQMVPQLLVLVRFVAGAVFVGFTRPQTDAFCLATSSSLPVAILVIALDAVILLLLFWRAFSTGLVANIQKRGSGSGRSKALMLIMLGLAVWTATSVTLMLGMRSMDLIARTAVPAIGLTLLITVLTGCAGLLASLRGSQSSPPEAPSPRRMNISRDISTSDSDYPPSRYEDIKEAAIRSSKTFVNPREAPLVKDETGVGLPIVARPITGVAGIGGVPIQGVLFPPPRLEAVTVPVPARKLETSGSLRWKKNLFDFGKSGPAAAISAGRITISNPIIQDNDDPQNPLNKIPTIGLEEAVKAERERRAGMPVDSDPVVKRPAPPPPSVTPEEALKRAVSVKRKEVASISSQPSMMVSMALQPDAGGISTSAQLSPGGDEVRRRSPRQSTQYQQLSPVPAEQVPQVLQVPQPAMLPKPQAPQARQAPQVAQAPQPLQARPVSPPRQEPVKAVAVLTQQGLPRPEIRPSRALLPSPKSPQPEAPKNAVQRRPTIGLPSNPRARGLKIVQESGLQRQQTVMFVNNIVYNDPTVVQTIIKGANDRAIKGAAAPDTPGTARSVVNRPRPIPRKAPESPAQASPAINHRRSKSGGSLSRKSILTSTPGSPTQLPPLPPPPRSAGVGLRPHPNDTKSMTFDEKMTMFFPAPPSGKGTKRRSSVPELPPIPATYLDDSSPTESERRRSNRTTRTSIRTGSILDVDEITRKPLGETYQLSPLAYPSLADEVGNSWLPGISTENESRKTPNTKNPSEPGAKRASSPLIPPVRSSAWTETTDTRTRDTRDELTTNWGSVYSPELAVSVPVPQKAYPTAIRKGDRKVSGAAKTNAPQGDRRDSDVLPNVQDTAASQKSGARGPRSESEVAAKANRASQGQWHRRVGDDCPTFSDRKEKTRSRKMSPPTPLQLNSIARKNAIVIQAEPSPLESPEHALQQIQAQLEKLEQPNSGALETPSRRLALLENLEKEIGQQEDHWQEMKHDIGRDSLSSVQTTSPTKRSSRVESLVVPVSINQDASIRASIGAERRASRLARLRYSGTIKPNDTAAHSPEGPRMNNWQKRLTEAQVEYMDAAAELLRNRNVNYMSLSNAQLGSPTPPDSDQSDEEAPSLQARLKIAMAKPAKKVPEPALLWAPARKWRTAHTSLLWEHVRKSASEHEPLLPGLSVRPAQRKETAPLPIHSSQLWRKPYWNVNHAATGLWRPPWASAAPPAESMRQSSQAGSQSQSQKAPRPLTQRPPRRNKRVTLLPDILESPQPLPDKRGTLGIFQFPWGERSDTASIQPRPTRMAMPGTMTSGGSSGSAAAEARLRQLEAAEYSSSFFDDYDDDEDGERNSDEGEGDDSDDGFDETTLWEIASLLKTDDVPSKNSMFLSSTSGSVVDDYMDEFPSDDEDRSSREQSIMIGLAEEPQELLFEQPREPLVPEALRMTEAAVAGRPTLPTTEEGNVAQISAPGLAAATQQPRPSMIPRPVPAPVETAAPAPAPTPAPKPSQIPRLAPGEIKKARMTRKQESVGLWDRPEKQNKAALEGLFEVNPSRTEYRTTPNEPAAGFINRKPRQAGPAQLEKVSSMGLWVARKEESSAGHWLAGGVVKTSKMLWANSRPKARALEGGLFQLDPHRTDYRTTSSEPAAKNMDRKPRQVELKPLEVLPSTALWTIKSKPERAEQHWIIGKLKSKATTRGKVPATRADWEAALKEAIAASYPHTKRARRVVATPADWDAALHEALTISARPTSPPFDAATCHPVFAAKSLATRSESFHPAATGYTYDVAAVHPVFFGSLAITCPVEAVHPVMSSYVAKKLRHQRSSSRRSIHDQSSSRSRSLSRSDSRGSRRKEEMMVPARVLEQVDSDLPPPVPRFPAEVVEALSRNAMIQAQVEALEQEKIFVQRAAQEEYKRRASIAMLGQPLAEPEPMPSRPAETVRFDASQQRLSMGVQTVEDLQRHLESQAQVRQSLMWTTDSASPAGQNRFWSPSSSPPSAKAQVPRSNLWSPSRQPSRPSRSSTGLWTPPATKSSADISAAAKAPGLAVTTTGEDAEAIARHARGRKTKQEKLWYEEILARIAAFESGIDPSASFPGQEMWTRGGSEGARRNAVRGGHKNWLSDARDNNRVSRVVLRY